MNSRWLLIGGLGFALTTCVAGWLHGRSTNRWGPQSSLQAAGELLEKLPQESVGGWHVANDERLSPEVAQILECKGQIVRRYVHEQTGDVISVVVLLGPSGPIAVHTPEICYSSRDYSIQRDRTAVELKDAKGQFHKLWDLQLASRNDGLGTPLRVLYGWTANGKWQATSGPRFAFGGEPMLYKIQLAGSPTTQGTQSDFNPCQDFLEHFLAQLSGSLVSASSSPTAP